MPSRIQKHINRELGDLNYNAVYAAGPWQCGQQMQSFFSTPLSRNNTHLGNVGLVATQMTGAAIAPPDRIYIKSDECELILTNSTNLPLYLDFHIWHVKRAMEINGNYSTYEGMKDYFRKRQKYQNSTGNGADDRCIGYDLGQNVGWQKYMKRGRHIKRQLGAGKSFTLRYRDHSYMWDNLDEDSAQFWAIRGATCIAGYFHGYPSWQETSGIAQYIGVAQGSLQILQKYRTHFNVLNTAKHHAYATSNLVTPIGGWSSAQWVQPNVGVVRNDIGFTYGLGPTGAHGIQLTTGVTGEYYPAHPDGTTGAALYQLPTNRSHDKFNSTNSYTTPGAYPGTVCGNLDGDWVHLGGGDGNVPDIVAPCDGCEC